MSDVNLTVMGMSCGHCKTSVEKALKSVPGVEKAEVNLQEGTAKVVGNAPVEKLIAAVQEEGYSAQVG
ncbi:MAG: cation transporter [Thermaceae bacterium]|nr:cation transporter [Thermaceae bacterium]